MKSRRRGNVKIPVTGLRDVIAMGLHTSFRTLGTAPDEDSFEQLRDIVNMVGLAVEGDKRFADQMLIINSASSALNQIGAKTGPVGATTLELLPVLNAVNVIDAILPRLDVARLHQANVQLRAQK